MSEDYKAIEYRAKSSGETIWFTISRLEKVLNRIKSDIMSDKFNPDSVFASAADDMMKLERELGVAEGIMIAGIAQGKSRYEMNKLFKEFFAHMEAQ